MAQISETDLILNADGSVYHLNLLPENISDTIITVGDPNRVGLVSQHFDDIEFEMSKREFVTQVGYYKSKKITVISTGIGTDNIEIFFSEIDAIFNIDLKTRKPKTQKKKIRIVRIGTSGAIQEDILVGSHLVSDYAVGLDNLMNFYNLPLSEYESSVAEALQIKLGLDFRPYVVRGSKELLEKVGAGMIIGNTVTCPGFYAPQGRTLRVPTRYPLLLDNMNYFSRNDFLLSNLEMETSGYYAMARLLGHEALSVNAILANRITNTFATDPNEIVGNLILKVLDAI